MMKTIKVYGLNLILLVSVSLAHAVTPVRFDNGLPVFAISTVAGVPVFNSQEQTEAVARTGQSAVPLTPSFYEMAVSTTITGFSNCDEFRSILNSKPTIQEKILSLESDLLGYQDLRTRYPAVAGIQGRINKLIAQIDLLVGLHQSLP